MGLVCDEPARMWKLLQSSPGSEPPRTQDTIGRGPAQRALQKLRDSASDTPPVVTQIPHVAFNALLTHFKADR